MFLFLEVLKNPCMCPWGSVHPWWGWDEAGFEDLGSLFQAKLFHGSLGTLPAAGAARGGADIPAMNFSFCRIIQLHLGTPP